MTRCTSCSSTWRRTSTSSWRRDTTTGTNSFRRTWSATWCTRSDILCLYHLEYTVSYTASRYWDMDRNIYYVLPWCTRTLIIYTIVLPLWFKSVIIHCTTIMWGPILVYAYCTIHKCTCSAIICVLYYFYISIPL